MRILDEESGRSLDRVTIYVTNREALELKDSLEIVIGSNEDARHEHISSEEAVQSPEEYLRKEIDCG